MTPDEVRMMDNRYALLFIRGERPIKDLKCIPCKQTLTAQKEFLCTAQKNIRLHNPACCDTIFPEIPTRIFG
ncbi:MAG: hypothetical protein ACLVLG_11455 [Anaerovoracaceae bacterium]